MKMIKKATGQWVLNLPPKATAMELLQEIISVAKSNKYKEGEVYYIREFSKEQSIDITGSEVVSPYYSIVSNELLRIVDSAEDINDICNAIEIAVGAPNLPNKLEFTKELEIRSLDDIKNKLEKYKKKEKLEIKTLRDICPIIGETQNNSTKSALVVLNSLYSNPKYRNYTNVAGLLLGAIFDREKDKLFYVRRHPKEKILHKCSDDAILTRIEILEWMFIDGNPFAGIQEAHRAISRLS
jgi:hypothetical protein